MDAGTLPSGSEAKGWKIKSNNRSGIFKRLKKKTTPPNTTWHHRWVPRSRAFIACPLAGGPHRPVEEVCSSPGTGRGDLATSSHSAAAPSSGFLRGLEPPWPPGPPTSRPSPLSRLALPTPAARGAVVEQLPIPGAVNTALNFFFSPSQPLQSKDYLLHTHAAALFSRINQCFPLLPGERTRRCPGGPDSSPGNVAWPQPRPGTARIGCLVSQAPADLGAFVFRGN